MPTPPRQYRISTVVPTAPSNVSLPTVTGTAEVGEVLSASQGSWTGSEPISYGFQWQRCDGACSDVSGATGLTYSVATGDVGLSLRVIVTAANSAGSASASSLRTGVVPEPPVAPSNVSLPTVTGVAEVGESLSAGQGSRRFCS